MGKAKLTNTSIDLLKNIRDTEKKQAGRNRADFAGVTTVSKALSASSLAKTSTLSQPFPLSGGTIIGPVAVFPKTLDVVSGAIDLSDTAAGNVGRNTSRVLVIGQGPAADALDTITGGVEGQMLYLQAAGYKITLTQAGNITTPDGVNFDVDNTGIALLQYDTLGAGAPKWRVVATYGGSGGGADNLGNHTATEALKLAGQDITDAGLINFQFDTDGWIWGTGNSIIYSVGLADTHDFQVNGTSRFGVDEDNVTVLNNTFRIRDTTSTGQTIMEMVSDDPSPGDFNSIASQLFYGENSVSSKELYAKVDVITNDITNGTEDGEYAISVTGAGFNGAARLVLNHRTLEYHRQFSNSLGNGCEMVFHNDSISPNDADILGMQRYDGNDSVRTQTVYAEARYTSEDVTNGTEDGGYELWLNTNGTLTQWVEANFEGNGFFRIRKSLSMWASIVTNGNDINTNGGNINMSAGELDFNAGGRVDFGDTATTIGSNGTASALTANPVGYVKIRVNGVEYQLPYYRLSA